MAYGGNDGFGCSNHNSDSKRGEHTLDVTILFAGIIVALMITSLVIEQPLLLMVISIIGIAFTLNSWAEFGDTNAFLFIGLNAITLAISAGEMADR